MKATLKTASYKRTEWKRGYLRVNGKFVEESWRSKNHRYFSAEISEGDSIDARGSEFAGGDGRSRWSAPRPEWVKVKFLGGKLICTNHKDERVSTPDWMSLELIEEEVAV